MECHKWGAIPVRRLAHKPALRPTVVAREENRVPSYAMDGCLRACTRAAVATHRHATPASCFAVTANVLVAAVVLLLRMGGVRFAVHPMPHTLLGGFLGLLLVFRTNAAYARFWEARQLWGRVMGATRRLSHTVLAHVQPTSPNRASHLLACLKAFPLALARVCQGGQSELASSVTALLPTGSYSDAAAALCLQMRLSICAFCAELRVAASQLAPSSRLGSGADQHAATMLEEEAAHLIGELLSSLGGCERILKTPVPFMYSRHTSRSLSVWCGTLPLVLVDVLGPATLPAMAALCWCIFGIEEIGHLIEQPFRSAAEDARESFCFGLPVDALARGVADDVQRLTEQAGALRQCLPPHEAPFLAHSTPQA